MRYGWPGNVRQLAGVLFRAALQCDGQSLTAEHFPHIAIQSRYSGRRTDFSPTLSEARSEEMIAGAPQVTLFTSDGHLRLLEDIEADIIRLAIGHYRGRMTEVARRLGIGRSTLYRKLGELGIDNAASALSRAKARQVPTDRRDSRAECRDARPSTRDAGRAGACRDRARHSL